MMQDEQNRKMSAPVSSQVIMLTIVVAMVFGMFVGYQVGVTSGSAGAWNQVKGLASASAQAAPEQGTYSREVIADCRDGVSRDPSIDCEAVLASTPQRQTSIDAAISAVRTIDASCPSPTMRDAATGNCVLASDVVLTEALRLAPGTTLDCKNHELTPSVNGEYAGWGDTRFGMPFSPSTPSVPNTGIVLAGETTGVTVKNCKISNFDFGVVIANSKIPPAAKSVKANTFSGNVVTARYRGFEILSSDNNVISDNEIYYFAPYAGGIGIEHDADNNLVKNNVIVGPNVDWWVPGPNLPGGTDDSDDWGEEAVRVRGAVYSYSFKIDGKLFVGTYNPRARADGNVVEGNDITIPTRWGNGLVSEALTDGTVFRRNTVRDVADAVSIVNHSYGHENNNRNTLVEDNVILGPASTGLQIAYADDVVARGNKVQNAEVGSLLGGDALGSVVFTKNLIADSEIGLWLFECCDRKALHSGEKVYLNDYVGNDLNIMGWVETPVDLSFDGKGNFWGHEEAPAFRPTDTDAPDLITDSYASLVPVSGLLDD